MAADDNEPATKGDLREGLRLLEERMATRVDATVRAANDRLVLELAGVVQRALGVNREDFAKGVDVVDEKYKDIPRRLAQLESDVAELKAHLPARRRSTKK